MLYLRKQKLLRSSRPHQNINSLTQKDYLKCQNLTPELDALKQSVANYFHCLKIDIISLLSSKQKQIQHWLNCFYFSHFSQHQVNIPLMSQLLQEDLSQLPQKKLNKTIKYLRKQKQKKQNAIFQIDMNLLSEDVHNFISEIKQNDILSKIKGFIDTSQLIQPRKIDLASSFKSTTSTSSKISQEAIQPASAQYQWKHIRITKNTKTLQINNRNVTDQDLIIQIPILETFTNIKQFQIRNNKITVLSCALIANCLKFLKVLDIRGNKVGDEGVIKIVHGVPILKQLFVSETNLSDFGGKQICKGVPELQTLWSEHNRLSGQVCLQISKKSSLRILSLVGNPINNESREEIKLLFLTKGYLNI